jgi:hypothetical protein
MASDPATVDVDDGVGVRFNFPGVGRFRAISWDEWFAIFDRDQLAFVYEEESAVRPEGERQPRATPPSAPSGRLNLVKRRDDSTNRD